MEAVIEGDDDQCGSHGRLTKEAGCENDMIMRSTTSMTGKPEERRIDDRYGRGTLSSEQTC